MAQRLDHLAPTLDQFPQHMNGQSEQDLMDLHRFLTMLQQQIALTPPTTNAVYDEGMPFYTGDNNGMQSVLLQNSWSCFLL